jgi:tetratricopeptide (TPR) repeat protein
MDHTVERTIESLNLEAIALAQRGDLQAATTYFERALVMAPNRPDLLNNLGLTLFRRGHSDDALACYTKALSIKPEYPDALFNKGNCLGHSKKKYADAITCFVEALLLEPRRPEILQACGFSHLMLGNLLTASCIFSRVAEIDPNRRSDPGLLNYVG